MARLKWTREKKQENQHIEEQRLGFLFDLYNKGVALDPTRYQFLVDHKYIEPDAGTYDFDRSRPHTLNQKLIKNYEVKTEAEFAADEHTDIVSIDENLSVSKVKVVEQEEYESHDNFEYRGKREIETHEWKPDPDHILNYTKSFVKWIDSINSSFLNKIPYDKFRIYKQQATLWLAQNESFADYNTREDQYNFAFKEKQRCTDNSLYFLNKYLFLKEGNSNEGGQKYKAWECQAVVCFLFDCGYNIMIGKPRQIGFSSTIGGLCTKRLIFHKSYFVKFITESLLKGQEIFEDKVKFPFYHMPEWIKPTVNNDRDDLLALFYKPVKGDIAGVESKMQVVAPTVTAINGGSPNLVAIDEIGLIGILGKMMNEGRPALFMVTDKGEMKMRRQLFCWGTGGNMKGAGKEFETEFKAAMEAWKERNFHYGIIPIFFDCFAKPGVTEEFYDQEKKFYYARGPASAIQFHQHYPTSIDDMFLVSSETIWPMESINKQIKVIKNLPALEKPKYGHFIPLYDYGNKKDERSDVPYEISGAEFIPVEDGDPAATTIIFRHPEEKWTNRYFQGTDPVYTETGHSLMASAIWDNVDGTVAACMNYRTQDYRYCYLQALLLGLYYDNRNCRNLVESNVGSGYNDYIDNKGFWRTLVPNNMLSVHLRIVAGQKMGINKKGNTGRFILNKLQELLEVYGKNIFIEEFFIQLKTYVRKTSREGHESFKVENAKYYYDDVIDAVTYAYICAQSFAHLNPVEPEANKARNVKHRYYYDDNYNLCIKKILV